MLDDDTVLLYNDRDSRGMTRKYGVEVLKEDQIRLTVLEKEFKRMVSESPNPAHIRSLLMKSEDVSRFY